MPPIAPLLALFLAVAAIDARAFDLQGHRGARGLAPENTLAAFRAALAIGVTTLETDVAVTKDGVLVLSHDPDLNPALVRDNGQWLAVRGPAIRRLTHAELDRYDVGRVDPESRYGKQWPSQVAADGERIPTLAALIALVRNTDVRLDIETKITPDGAVPTADPDTFARLLVGAIVDARMTSRATVQSFDWRTLIAVKRLAPAIETACLTAESPNFDTVRADATGTSPWHAGLSLAEHGGSLPKLVRAAGCDVWSANASSLTGERIAEAHAQRLKVLAWTVNDASEMARLIDLGADGIITDYPDRLRNVMQARGLPLPDPVPAKAR
jgi:glycerophosphoryl diester phosphodiesterase